MKKILGQLFLSLAWLVLPFVGAECSCLGSGWVQAGFSFGLVSVFALFSFMAWVLLHKKRSDFTQRGHFERF